MYGVPADLDLSFLKGSQLWQVQASSHQVNFIFDSDACIFVEREWDLLVDDVIVDRYRAWPREEPYHWHRLLDRKVVGWSVVAPICLAIEFEGGVVLRLFDFSNRYESFMIDPGAIIV